ncbi:hypothetical protein NYE39_04765 [Janibacter sp. FSL W8-0316]|uniref:WXG100 family type VII secretion target n=1 Tax=Janibacter sp. FSL W8-0316 TaxID=2975325 RepID=UPI0030F9AB57
MTVTDGMDTARARVVATQLKHQGAVLAGIGTQGSALADVLKDVWGGPDAEKFAREWQAARPALNRSSRDLDEVANELTRQADEQDGASEGGPGRGAAAGDGGGPGRAPWHGGRTPELDGRPGPTDPFAHPLGAAPAAWEAITDTLKDVWEIYTSPFFGLAQMVVDEVVGYVVDKLEKLDGRFKILGKLAKIAGVAGGYLSMIFGQVDMVQAVWRLFTEGPSVDGVLQFFEGLTGWLSGGLAIAAVFAGGTILGAPAGIVLGGAAAILAVISLGIGVVREYGPWFIDVVEGDPAWAAEVGFGGGGMRHGYEMPERNGPIPPPYKASDRRSQMGMLAGA